MKPELNPIDGSMMQVFAKSIDWVKENNYKGLVISGEGANFCAGANLSLILQAAEKKDFESLETFINTIQQIFQNIRFADYPVVAPQKSKHSNNSNKQRQLEIQQQEQQTDTY